MLFSREVPLAMAQPIPEGTPKSTVLALKANSAVKAAAEGLEQVTTAVGNLFHSVLPTASSNGDFVTLQAVVTVQKKLLVLDLTDLIADSGDDVAELLGQHVSIMLVSNKLDAKTKKVLVSEDVPIKDWAMTADMLYPTNFRFQMEFKVPKNFGTPGAIIVMNRHVHEFLLVSFSVQLPDERVINFPIDSWVYNTSFKTGRVFFSNELYLPTETPEGLVGLRKQELENLRGNGKGERKYQDRIYDYATYNDLGDPDLHESLKRPVLGGSKEFPYPRRIRTGRPPSQKDPKSESRGQLLALFYIPRDEKFDQVKFSDFAAETLRSGQHAIVPILKSAVRDGDQEFGSFGEIMDMYAAKKAQVVTPSNLTPQAAPNASTAGTTTQNPLTFIHEYAFPSGPDTKLLTFPLPGVIAADTQAWSTDVEFARRMLAGLNPLVITLLKEWPIKSKLDPAQFGDPISAITTKHIESGLEGLTVEKALSQKRLFIMDYHDIFLPYVNRINEQKKGSTYAPRALVFLTNEKILMPLAIELTLPPTKEVGKKSRVFTPPPPGSAKDWVWELAKAHVSSCDFAYHELISHFLRTHACIEPFIIATNRQLSVLHPIHNVLVPHYKNTMDINGAARKALINAGGIIEQNFTAGKYSMEMSAVVYNLDWRFDEQALPEDLIKRGMAVRDSSAKHGLKLAIEDYPYAADGLEIWDALKEYMTDHVKIFYKNDKSVAEDTELQAWWTEIRTVGHGDKKDAPGWPTLNSIESLIYTLTTIAWVASCHHAAVNFGQYAYAGFMPNFPSMTRKFIPEPGTPDWEKLHKNSERFYLDSISNSTQAASIMSTIEILATHAIDEEYLGQRATPNWSNDEKVLNAFAKFTQKMVNVENLIHERNADKSLRNRAGPVQLPYELLIPTSGPGLTGKGVPNSISI